MLETHFIDCPYCGERFETTIDLSAGSQSYIEDCFVCCRPIQVSLQVDHNGDLEFLSTSRDDE